MELLQESWQLICLCFWRWREEGWEELAGGSICRTQHQVDIGGEEASRIIPRFLLGMGAQKRGCAWHLCRSALGLHWDRAVPGGREGQGRGS